MSEPVRILIIEDASSDFDLAQREIRKAVNDCVFQQVQTRQDFLGALETFQPDLILSDYQMPSFDGMAALQLTQVHAKLTPFIIWTGTMSEDVAVECMKAGAVNYILKENIKRLGTAVVHALEERRLLLEHKQAEATIYNNEKRFRALIENGRDNISLLAVDGTLLWESPATVRSLGYAQDEFLGHNIFELMHPDDRKWISKLYAKLLQEPGSRQDGDFRLRHRDGSWRWNEATVTNMLNEPGVNAIVANYRDVTERKQSEMERQALLEIMQGPANTDDLYEFLKLIHHTIARVIYAENFFVAFYNKDSGLFEEVYSVDQYDQPSPASALEQSITSYVFRSGEPLLLTQALFDKLVEQGEVELVGTNSESWLGAPLKTPNGTIGVIVAQDYEDPNRYTERDKDFLALIGSQVALAIERKQAEVELYKSEERYRFLFENNPVPMWVYDLKTLAFLAVNDSAVEKYGYTREEFLHMTIADIRPTEEVSRLMEDVARQRPPLQHAGEWRHRLKDGTIIDVEITSHTLRIDEHDAALVVAQDITERKRAADQLNYHARLLRHINDAVIATDDQLHITAWNRAAEKMYGWTSKEVMGHPISEILNFELSDEQRAEARELLNESMVSRSERIYRRRDGRTIYVEANTIALLNQHGRMTGYLSVDRDISERKRAEENILQLAAIVKSSDDAIIGQSLEGRIVSWNPAAERLYGYSADEITGKPLSILFPPGQSDEAIRILERLKAGEHIGHFETVRVRKDSQQIHVSAAVSSIKDASGALIGTSAIERDISERKKAEEILRQSSLLEKGRRRSAVITELIAIFAIGLLVFILELNLSLFTQILINFRVTFSEVDELLVMVIFLGLGTAIFSYRRWKEAEAEIIQRQGIQLALRTLHNELETRVQERTSDLAKTNIALKNEITERKQAERALREHEQQLSSVYNTAADVLFLLIVEKDERYRFVSVNESFLTTTGLDKNQVVGKRVSDIIPEPALSMVLGKYSQAIQEKRILRWEETSDYPKGRLTGDVSIAPVFDETGSCTHLVGAVHDITERKRAEEAVRASEEQYRSLFEDSPISLTVEDFSDVKLRLGQLKKNGVEDIPAYLQEHPDFVIECANHVRILDVNYAGMKLYHARHKSELLGSLMEVLPALPPEQFEHELVQLANGRLNFEREGSGHTLTGEEIYINTRWSVAPGYEDTLAKVIISTADITERKRAEEQAQLQIQRLRSLRAIDLAISSSFDLGLTLDILLDQVIAQLKTDAAAILLFRPSTRTLEYGASRGFRSTAIREARVRLGEGYAGKAILERRIIHIPNLMGTDSEFSRALLLSDEDFNDYYCVPLIVKGEIKGVLEIFHRSALAGGADWLDFLETLAGQAALAIQDATLFENLQDSNRELFQAYDATIEGWSHALDLRDKETEGHSLRVTEMTMELARKFSFPDEQLIHIRWGALLHDIGKMGIPDSILLKPDKLSDEEWERMKKHPVFAFEMLSPITYLKSSLDIPYCHHEKWDGTGYPRGLKGEVIPLAARLFAVVDVWDALRSDRPYRKAWTIEKTLEHIKSLSGTHFDPKVTEYFLEMIGRSNG